MSNTTVIPISLPKELARKVDRVAQERSMTRSEYVRDLIRRQIAFSELEEFRIEAARRAKKAGLRTLDDAVRVVREIRDGKIKRRHYL